MGTYPLGPLLTARSVREDSLAREVNKAAAAVRAAREVVAAARAEFERYREWRPAEEARRFEAIRGTDVSLAGLERHRDEIDALRQEEFAKEEAVREAEKAVVQAEATEAKARAAHLEAVRGKKKIEEHRDRWRLAEQKLLDAAEEAELEDFPYQAGTPGDEAL